MSDYLAKSKSLGVDPLSILVVGVGSTYSAAQSCRALWPAAGLAVADTQAEILGAAQPKSPLWAQERRKKEIRMKGFFDDVPKLRPFMVMSDPHFSGFYKAAPRHERAHPTVKFARDEGAQTTTIEQQWGKLNGMQKATVDFLVMDMRGNELGALRGCGHRMVKAFRWVLVRTDFGSYYDGAPTYYDVCDYLQGEGLNPIGFFPDASRMAGHALFFRGESPYPRNRLNLRGKVDPKATININYDPYGEYASRILTELEQSMVIIGVCDDTDEKKAYRKALLGKFTDRIAETVAEHSLMGFFESDDFEAIRNFDRDDNEMHEIIERFSKKPICVTSCGTIWKRLTK